MAILVAALMAVLLVFTAFAVDLGAKRTTKARLEATADAGALAGAGALTRAGGTDVLGDGLPRSVHAAVDYVFRNLGAPVPSTHTRCGTAMSSYCFAGSGPDKASVEIAWPYSTAKVKPDGSPYAPSELVHTHVCLETRTTFARVFGTNTLTTCADATARGAGGGVNTVAQDMDQEPMNPCAEDVFDPSKYFPGDNKVKAGDTVGATYLDETDLDLGSVSFTVDGSEVAATDPDLKVVAKSPPPGVAFKYEIKYKLPSSFAAGIHTVLLTAHDSDQTVPQGCGSMAWTFAVNARASVGSPCKEDLFRGSASPADGSVVTPGMTVSATYSDETPMNINPGFQLIFNIDPDPATGPTMGQNVSYVVDFNVQTGQSGEDKFKERVSYLLPSSLTNGQHTIVLQAWDSDQNKAGGDCGIARWTINFTGGSSLIELIE